MSVIFEAKKSPHIPDERCTDHIVVRPQYNAETGLTEFPVRAATRLEHSDGPVVLESALFPILSPRLESACDELKKHQGWVLPDGATGYEADTSDSDRMSRAVHVTEAALSGLQLLECRKPM